MKLLKESDQAQLIQVKALYGNMDANALMKHTYINFPYWATKSVKASSILSKEEQQRVESAKPKNNKTILFTIGYEGISLEEYLNRLLQNDVRCWWMCVTIL